MSKRLNLLFVMIISGMLTANAQQKIQLPIDPVTKGCGTDKPEKSENEGAWITNVSSPELWIYQADESLANGISVIICPGGGYGGLAFNHEGIQFAQWLNQRGITAMILKYRMPHGCKELPLSDARQAMLYAKNNAKALNIDKNKIGVSGFSAGGHLAACMSTVIPNEDKSLRPAFSILFYPVITMELVTHGGSRNAFLGKKPSQEDILLYSIERQINKKTPPAILLLSDDDSSVNPKNSTNYYLTLKENQIPASMYIFPEGGHGWGMNDDFRYQIQMLDLLDSWLKPLGDKLE